MELVNVELQDTIELMCSGDYKKRFQAEYLQTKIRYDKLCTMLIKKEAGTLGFEPTCSEDILLDQKYYMEEYLRTMRVRAEIEGIDLVYVFEAGYPNETVKACEGTE